MNPLSLLTAPAVHLALAFLLMQGLAGAPPESPEDPFARATTPPVQFLLFNEDFLSLDLDRFFDWINPSRGLVANGVLLTKSEAESEFRALFRGSSSSSLVAANFHFNYGQFARANMYQADGWLEIKLREGGNENWYRLHHEFVFEIGSSRWYLVQWEYIPPDVALPLGYESQLSPEDELPGWVRQFAGRSVSGSALSGVANWPLLIGTSFAEEGELHPLEGKTPSGATWRLADALAARKPVVLLFFSVQWLSAAFPEDFEGQMEFLEGLYDTFGYEDLYIYGVTDEAPEVLDWLGGSGHNNFAPLLDEGSNLHTALNIDLHPYIVVFDREGTVVALSKTFHPSAHGMIEDRIREVVSRASERD